jgi:acetolactate synthase-1/2/3 large subunit
MGMGGMKASDYIARFLQSIGCEHVFGYPGGAVTHLIDSLYRCPGIRFIGTYLEQAAAFAAEGYARMGNRIGVALATSGPGATNLITGIGSAYFDSIPCLYITGQVNTYEYKGDRKVRQLGFQETDIVSIVRPVTKYAARLGDAGSIRFELEKAVHIATSGRKGPVLLDIPMNIQRAELNENELSGYAPANETSSELPMENVIQLMNRSARPVILAGGGVRLSGAAEMLKRVAERLQISVVSSLMGRDAFDNASGLYAGMIGSYGHRCANLTAANSDLVLALGSRLDTRQTGTLPHTFARGATLIRVDIDGNELENRIKPNELDVRADTKEFLTALYAHTGEVHIHTKEWLNRVGEYRRRYPLFTQGCYPDPNGVMREVSECLGPRDTVCLDVGQNQMWAAQSLCVTEGQRLLTSGGMGSMGFALPCAVGAYYGGAQGRVVAIAGDGGAQMNIQEMELIKRNGIPIKIIVMNNRSLGMIRQFQEMYFEGRYAATVRDYDAPDFCAVARAYGIPAVKVSCGEDMEALKDALYSEGPALVEVALPGMTSVVPKLAVNRPVEEQEPPLDTEEHLSNMIVEPYDAQRNGGAKHE